MADAGTKSVDPPGGIGRSILGMFATNNAGNVMEAEETVNGIRVSIGNSLAMLSGVPNASDLNSFFAKAASEVLEPPLRLFKEVQEQLQCAKRELLESEALVATGRMARCIAHDLRHHLSAVYSSAEFMSEQRTTQRDREELQEEIRSAIHCMTDMLDSLLLFAQTGQALRSRLETLNTLIGHAVNMVRIHPDALNVHLVVKNMPTIEGWIDSQKLGSAVYNLLLNACQAAKRGTPPRRVEVNLSEDQNSIYIRVVDCGPGVPDFIRKSLFEPFVRAERTRGIGLGLTIAERAAREHGGSLYIEESKSRHTTFVLQLSKPALSFGPKGTNLKSGALAEHVHFSRTRLTT